MTTSTKPPIPILFLAFANDRDDQGRYLLHLAQEAREVQKTLREAEQRGHCQIVLRQNATPGEILDVFQDAHYRNRIALFHFGGHADGYRLLLETAAGQAAAADAASLARFLAQQGGLQLVFLNGCSTAGQVSDLLDADVPAVIATDQAVDDAVATAFAARFYKGLAGGAAIGLAFKEAEAAMRMEGGQIFRHAGSITNDAGGRIPWQLHIRPGADAVADWSLPQAVADLLFGLPPLPALNLPETPYRKLDWYHRKDAEVFFGRGQEIRELYDRVTSADADPIILLYGQSGVGKSSLLEAGLLPRLEASHEISYVRRDQAKGLLGTLAAALKIAQSDDVASAWRNIEARPGGKPLLVVLDQVEEFYTRPNPEQPGEMSEFLDVLVELFGDASRQPRGRLILGFRKEWLAELDKRLAERDLPRVGVFLERLGRAGIAEVVASPATRPRLRARYGLVVTDAALPGLIADDLLADRESPVAPMLAILLDDMWKEAKERNPARPVFDETLYDEFRLRGLSLDQFLKRQLDALRKQQSAVVDSGLALDVLAYYTTPLGTAEQRTLADLTETYRHRQDVLLALVQACRDLYLLVDPAQNEPRKPRASRLTHDTLAPHVRKRFDESDAPGQRARRILESRFSKGQESQASDDGQGLAPLGDADLDVVVAGRDGMRAWRVEEERLVQTSEADRARRLEEQARVAQEREEARRRELEQAERLAEEQRLRAEEADAHAKELQEALERAKRETRRAQAGELTAHAQNAIANHRNDPSLALLLAIQAVEVTWRAPERVVTINADAVLRAAVDAAPAHVLTLHIPDGGGILSAAYSPDSAQIVTASGDGTARIWDAATGEERLTLGEPYTGWARSWDGGGLTTWRTYHKRVYTTNWAAFSPADAQIVTASSDWTARIWDATTGEAVRTLSGHNDSVNSAVYSPDGAQIVTASDDETARIWDAATGEELRTLSGHDGDVNSAVYSPDGTQIVTAGDDETARIWDAATGEELRTLSGHDGDVNSAAYSPDGTQIVTASTGMTVRIWDARTGVELRQLSGNSHGANSAAYSPSGAQIVTSDGYRARVWDAQTGREVRQLSGHYDTVSSAAYSPNGTQIVTASHDERARVWDVATGAEPRQLNDRDLWVKSATYSPNGSHILTASARVARILDAATGAELHALSGHSDVVNSAAYSPPDGAKIVTASDDTTARIWESATGAELLTLSGHDGPVRSAAYSPNGTQIVTAAGDTVRIWDATTGRELRQFSNMLGDKFNSAAYSPDGQRIVTATGEGAFIYDATTGVELHYLGGHGDVVLSAAYSPDGAQIVTASRDTVCVHDAATGAKLRILFDQTVRVNSATYSPDGTEIVTAGYYDGTARIWDAMTGQELRQLSLGGHDYNVPSAAYHPNGTRILTANQLWTAQIWIANIDDLLTEARRRIQRESKSLTREERQRYGLE